MYLPVSLELAQLCLLRANLNPVSGHAAFLHVSAVQVVSLPVEEQVAGEAETIQRTILQDEVLVAFRPGAQK